MNTPGQMTHAVYSLVASGHLTPEQVHGLPEFMRDLADGRINFMFLILFPNGGQQS